MAKNRNTFEKRRKEMEKKRKAEEKRAKRHARRRGIEPQDPADPEGGIAPEGTSTPEGTAAYNLGRAICRPSIVGFEFGIQAIDSALIMWRVSSVKGQ